MAERKARKRKKRVSPHKALLAANRHRYEDLLAAQGGRCALCPREPSPRRRLDMDHCHTGMFIRGLLCVRCNRALTYWITAEWCRKAADYLERGAV